jgi:hypothetical protein
MEFTTMFSQNGKELSVLNNFKFEFKYESKINGNHQTWECTKKNMQGKISFHKEKTLLQEKSVLDHSHESDSTIERQAVNNNIKQKIYLNSIYNKLPQFVSCVSYRICRRLYNLIFFFFAAVYHLPYNRIVFNVFG